MTDDGTIISYISTGMKHEYIRLSKNNCRVRKAELLSLYDEDFITGNTCSPFEEGLDDRITLDDALGRLSAAQKSVVIKAYFLDMKEKDIALKLGVTRQAVNQMKKSALKKLKKILGDTC